MKFNKFKINETKLPTNRNIIEYLLFLRHEGTARVPKSRQLINYAPTVIKKVMELWQRANIPIIKRVSIRKRIKALVEKYFAKNFSHNETEWSELFRVSLCKCDIEIITPCSCPGTQQIPGTAKQFLIDQCGPRQLSFDDMTEHESESDIVSHTLPCDNFVPSTIGYAPSITSELLFQETRREISPPLQPSLQVSEIKLRNYSSALDRTDTSNRGGALLATMLLKDIRIAIADSALKNKFSEDTANKCLQLIDDIIIDKSKVHRERVNFRKEAKALGKTNDLLQCISFDGKRDLTLKKINVQNKVRMVKVMEEHVTLVKEPGSKFIGYTTPTRGSGQEIQNGITNFLAEQNYKIDHLVAISCDGTPTNTGRNNGVISCMERYLKRPLQWFVCLFHFNELPLNALLRHFFGKQKGPGIWPDQFGKEIAECEKYSVSSLLMYVT